jgi:hypothetical protein
VAVLVALIGVAGRAQADPGSGKPPAVATETRWYGWQTLLTDGGAVALPVVAATSRNEPLTAVALVAGAGVFALGAPIVHLAHGRPGAFGLSLGLRLALPALAAFAFSRPCRGECNGPVLTLLLLPAPVIIDATALAWEKRPVPAKMSWTVSPLRLAGGELGLGVAGRF